MARANNLRIGFRWSNRLGRGKLRPEFRTVISLPLRGKELLSAARSPLQYRMRLVVGAAGVFFVAVSMHQIPLVAGDARVCVLTCKDSSKNRNSSFTSWLKPLRCE